MMLEGEGRYSKVEWREGGRRGVRKVVEEEKSRREKKGRRGCMSRGRFEVYLARLREDGSQSRRRKPSESYNEGTEGRKGPSATRAFFFFERTK